jgi:hypothetical protein
MKTHIINPIGSTFIKICWDGKKLSITGVEGPVKNGNAVGSYGQIIMHEWTGLDNLMKNGHLKWSSVYAICGSVDI